MTVEIKADVRDAGNPDNNDKTFEFCFFGNFSGSPRARSSWETRAVNRNSWDGLFEELEPSLQMTIELPKTDDLTLELQFRSLADYGEKGLSRKVPLLRMLKALSERVSKASREDPLDLRQFGSEYAELSQLEQIVAGQGSEEVIDLLSMVDIGEEDDGGLDLPQLKNFFGQAQYGGDQRSRLTGELNRIRDLVLDQIQAHDGFKRLHGCWRALKHFLSFKTVKISIVDCRKEEWCDATFSLFIKPDTGKPQPIDLAVYCEETGYSEDDRHWVHHLGRMAEALACPMILESSAALFGCKTWAHLTHLRDISGRMGRPELIKWRKLRDEPGASWLFMAVNPVRLDHGEEDQVSEQLAAPASFVPALVIAQILEQGKWPSEMLHPGYQPTLATRCLARLDEQQGYDLSFEGFCAVSGKENSDRIHLLGMLGLGNIKLPARQQLEAANLVEYSLSYRFYCGCLSRFLQANEQTSDLVAKLSAYGGIRDEDGLVCEEADGQKIFRIKPSFTIFGVQPDVILAI